MVFIKKLSTTTRRATIYVLLLIALYSEVQSTFCPTICDCQFDTVVTDNLATCRKSNKTVDFRWQSSRKTNYRPQLIITCQSNEEFICSEVVEFSVSFFRMKIKSCHSSLMRCIGRLPSTIIEKVETEDVVGGYTKETFKGLHGVKELRLNLIDDDISFPIEAINSLSFAELYINGGNFELPPNIFSNSQSSFDVVELQNNNISVLDRNSLNGLQSTNLRILNNNFEYLSANTFVGVQYLQNLQIAENKLKNIEAGAFASKTLTHLRLEKNRIEFLPNGLLNEMDKFDDLRILQNKVDITLDTHVFSELPPSVKWIEIYKSKLHNLTDTLFYASSFIQTLKLHETKIEELPEKIFWDLISLTHLSLSGNHLKYIPEGMFTQLTKLVRLNLNYNHLTTLSDDQFSFSPNLKVLFLDQNNLTTININSFNDTRLQTLTLLGNGLECINGKTDILWKDMNTLNLAANKLRTFEEYIFGLNNLTNVDLSRNEITTIMEYKIDFHKKTVIDLRRNQISQVIRDSTLKEDIKGGTIAFYLSNNPLQCDCKLTTVLHEWNKAGYLHRFEDITCSDEQFLSKINAYILCNRKHALIALVGSSTIGALIMIIILISIITNRQKIWDYILDAVQREEPIDTVSIEMEPDEVKPYDVFISFAHQDEVFVTDQLMPMLECEFGLKVCVHYRDWVVGELISDQIKESVENSKITVIILTENFLESEWSCLEFRTAHEMSIEDGKPRVILVLLDETVAADERLSPELKLYVSINTYLLWNDPKFWDKLKKVLPKPEKRKILKD